MKFRTLHPIFFLSLSLVVASGQVVAASCVSGSLSSYVSLGAAGCSTDALTFSNFVIDTFPGSTAQQIDPAALSINPLSNGFALLSSSAISASEGQLFGFRLTFDVAGSSLTGGAVAFGPGRSVSGDGVLTAFLDAGSAGNAIAISIDGVDDTPASFTSSATGNYAAFLELGVDGGTAGAASLGPELVTLTFSAGAGVTPVPEPATVVLTLAGLAALYARRRSLQS